MAQQSGLELQSADKEQLRAVGIADSEVARQINLLVKNSRCLRVVRPCTPGDGVLCPTAEEQAACEAAAAELLTTRGLTHFVPASGAATRMFAELSSAAESPEKLTPSLLKVQFPGAWFFLEHLREFPFFQELAAQFEKNTSRQLSSLNAEKMLAEGLFAVLVNSLLSSSSGLGFRKKPKALIPFHRYQDGSVRLAMQEHIDLLQEVVADKGKEAHIHFTLSPEHEAEFKQRLESHSQAGPGRPSVSWSFQKAETNAVALTLDAEGNPNGLLRDSQGKLILRPAGHGALLRNLQELADGGADVVYLNNIDNILPRSQRPLVVSSERVLLGKLAMLRRFIHQALSLLDAGASLNQIREILPLIDRELGFKLLPHNLPKAESAARSSLRQALYRPIRVVGVVKNLGEPGGGPYWTSDEDGNVSLQIVEKDELAAGSKPRGTHFNPVRIAAALRDHQDRPFILDNYVNQQAIFSAEKIQQGQKIRILERPGLWNGSMSRWITAMLETPADTFAPVKTVIDLLRPAHLEPTHLEIPLN